jgi:hypothetical protein
VIKTRLVNQAVLEKAERQAHPVEGVELAEATVLEQMPVVRVKVWEVGVKQLVGLPLKLFQQQEVVVGFVSGAGVFALVAKGLELV